MDNLSEKLPTDLHTILLENMRKREDSIILLLATVFTFTTSIISAYKFVNIHESRNILISVILFQSIIYCLNLYAIALGSTYRFFQRQVQFIQNEFKVPLMDSWKNPRYNYSLLDFLPETINAFFVLFSIIELFILMLTGVDSLITDIFKKLSNKHSFISFIYILITLLVQSWYINKRIKALNKKPEEKITSNNSGLSTK